MNLFELFVKIGVDDQASGKLKDLGGKLGNGLKTAAKIGTAAVGAAAAGITALTTAAINNYAEYEQLVGGVETLFKDSAGKVQEYAANAYKTAGMSANEYMSTVTSFSASLLQSLGGDTDKAAEYANQALTDMSDNANKMGTSMEMIQNAYQGFAKQNYTMLDNLKLGYGGTKEEMARLIKDAAKLDKSIDANDMSFANIVKAINVVQTEMGITGTTAKEAASTISGSVSSMKSAWSNLVAGLADENANLGVLVDNVIQSAFTVVDNILPRIEQALPSVATAITTAIPPLIQKISEVIDTALPTIIESAISIIDTLIQAISDNKDMLLNSAITIIMQLSNGILNMLPEIIQLGLDLIVSLANGIAESLPELIPTIVDVILQIVDTLTDPTNLSNLLQASLTIITEIAYGLMDAIPQLVEAAISIIENLVVFLLDPKNILKLVKAAIEIVIAIGVGLVKAIPQLVSSVVKLITSVVDMFKKTDWAQIGKDMINGLWNGLKNMWEKLKKWFTGAWDGLVGGVKKLLGIHSPSRVFAGIGENMALGLEKGWDNEFVDIKKGIENGLDFGTASVDFDSSVVGKNNSSLTDKIAEKLSVFGENATIVVQSVLDGKIIGETAYQYSKKRERAYGG